ncbi:potassium-transporting ATPase subunit C [Nocardia flavorosea]|uniref:potassium-transporting ATPase subunit C n=1 Tax=Nocardia flavorosea TaxID=53429 RepID=UPI0018953F82|nr:potassium-transporting ATPase subunit C [Nocardia flavorosea]MBF6352142.1 potassium-transporting ATPase subunit C [Nocardia flavorosea]
MPVSDLIRQHLAGLRALLILTLITGFAYPGIVWVAGQLPGLHDKSHGSIIEVDGRAVGSSQLGQSFTDANGDPIAWYFQSRPSAAGDGYDTLASGGSNLGPENIVDTPADPALLAAGSDPESAGFAPSLLTQVCTRSHEIGLREGVDGARPFCTPGGVGAVLSVLGPRAADGTVLPQRVVSVNEPCRARSAGSTPVFLAEYQGVPVECAQYGEDYSTGRIIPMAGNAVAEPAVPADAVTSSGSGLDPHISPAYAEIQVNRVAAARGIEPAAVRELLAAHTSGRVLGFAGEPRVHVLELNLDLDSRYPVARAAAGE